MLVLLRQFALLAVAAALSWWLLLERPAGYVDEQPAEPKPSTLSLELLPFVESQPDEAPPEASPEASESEAPPMTETPKADPPTAPEPAALAEAASKDVPSVQEDEPVEPTAAEEEPAIAALPPELGVPEGLEESDLVAATEQPTSADPEDESQAQTLVSQGAEELRTDPELLSLAELELSGESRRGFQSELLASPEEQIKIARAFGEELVLVPYQAIDPQADDPFYYRLRPDQGNRIERVSGAPPLGAYRQYRDLFGYDYARLPAALRDLRRSVLDRGDVYLFAALMPASEWAVVIGRRRAALQNAGRSIDEVKRFVMRYIDRADGRYDIHLERIDFADGSHFAGSSATPE